MRLTMHKDLVECANGAARGVLWILFAGCVLAATIYDVSHWVVW